MALKVTKVDVWATDMNDQPGGLADRLEPLSAAGAKLECVVARRKPDQPGSGVAWVTPIKGRKLQDAARAAGWQPAANIATVRVEGPDRAGLGAAIMRAIGEAGVNVRGVSAAVIGRNFVAYVGFDSAADASAAAKAIKSADRKGARRR